MTYATRAALVLGPAGSAIATYFWTDGRYGATGGTILVLAMVVWAYGLTVGAVLGRTRIVPLWTAALLCAGALAFPVSRILRIDLVAYLADALLVVAFAAIARSAIAQRPRRPSMTNSLRHPARR